MNFTVGLILLFLNIFLPGILFLRFYFTGDFSKQFTTRAPIVRVIFYSLFPGIIIQSVALWIYDGIDSKFTILNALEIFSNMMESNSKFCDSTRHFLENKIWIYFCFTISTAITSILLGQLSSWVVLKTKLDIRYKVLRFKNHWYYVFSGDIQKFPKFKNNSKKLGISHEEHPRGVLVTVADVLVNPVNGVEKYRGVVVDYELDSKDIQKLDKIYLFRTTKQICDKDGNVSTIKIPGDIFVIENDKILNLNLRYIQSKRTKTSPNVKKVNWSKFAENITLIAIIAFSSMIFFHWPVTRQMDTIINEFNWFQKIFIIISLLSSASVIFYDKKEGERDKSKYKDVRNGMWILVGISLTIIIYEIVQML